MNRTSTSEVIGLGARLRLVNLPTLIEIRFFELKECVLNIQPVYGKEHVERERKTCRESM